MGLGNFWASIIAVLITGCLVIVVAVGVVKGVVLLTGDTGREPKGCDFRNWEVLAEPIDGKGLVRLRSYSDFYLELPFKEGDTVSRWFDDNQWNRIVEEAENAGLNVTKYKFKVISIKKNCK